MIAVHPARRAVIVAAILAPVAAHAAPAAAPEDEHARQMREDWPFLARYAAENAAVIASGVPVRTVFMGDSITEGWRATRPAFFPAARACRGISGQTTPQMVLRMMADVVALKPRAVHIMAGTNDIAGNTGPMTIAQTCDNLRAMAAIARAAGIAVVLASVPPAAGFPWRPGLETRTPIATINRWLAAFARTSGATWLDYHPALGDSGGAMRPGFALDGVHPTAAGYAAMEAVAAPVLARFEG